MKLAEYSVRRPITVLMAVISVLVLGFISLQRLPLALMPDISSTSLSVNVSFPSSAPSEVEREITRPLEEVLSTLNHLERMSSSSSGGGANVRLEFKSGTNMDLISLDIRDRLDQVKNRLPEGVEQISIRRWQSSDRPVFRFAMGWSGERKELYSFIENVVRPHLERIDGVANVDVRGIDAKQILIDLDPELLQAYRIDVSSLGQALRNANVNVAGGYVIDGGKKYALRTVGEFTDVEQIRNLPLQRGRLRLSDVAQVRYDFPEKTNFSRLNSEESVSISVFKASTANVVSVCRFIEEELVALKQMPQYGEFFEYQVFDNQSEAILSSINDLKNAGIYGGLLAAGVLFLFLLKFRSTLIISLAIPVSIVFTFAFMYLLRVFFNADLSINIVSMMGLMVAVGMLVDSSVVVLENIYRYKQDEGLSAFQAAIRGAREVGVAVLASTATTVVVFLSFIFVEDSMSSRWTRDFGIAVSVALVASLIVSLTLIPMVSSRIFTGKERKKQRLLVLMSSTYGSLMRFMLRWRFITLILLAFLGWSSYALFNSIDRDLMPNVPERRANFDVRMEKSFSIEEMQRLFERIESELLSRKEELEIVSISTGFSEGRTRGGTYRGDVDVYFASEGNKSSMVLAQSVKDLLPVVPGVEYRMGRMRHFGGGSEMGVEVQLKGDDPGVLELYGEIVRERLYSVPAIRDVQTTLESGDDEIHFQVDRKKTEQFGVTAQTVARAISSALNSRATTRLKGEDGEIDIIVQLEGGNRISLQEMENYQLQNRQGEMIPLNAVVQASFSKGPETISREDRKAVLSVVGNTQGGGMMSLSAQVSDALSDLKLPGGYSWSLGSSWRRFRESESANTFSMILAIIFMYIIMAALFESFVHPFTILLTVPFSIIGVAAMFYMTNTTLNSMANLGILVLFGLVVNNGIILLDHINLLRENGMERNQAVLKAGMDRLRPILMTAATSLIGLMPLTLPFLAPQYFPEVEGRARMWAPVSLAVFGGLTTSTFLTLIILPTVYTYMDDLSRGLARIARWFSKVGGKPRVAVAD